MMGSECTCCVRGTYSFSCAWSYIPAQLSGSCIPVQFSSCFCHWYSQKTFPNELSAFIVPTFLLPLHSSLVSVPTIRRILFWSVSPVTYVLVDLSEVFSTTCYSLSDRLLSRFLWNHTLSWSSSFLPQLLICLCPFFCAWPLNFENSSPDVFSLFHLHSLSMWSYPVLWFV